MTSFCSCHFLFYFSQSFIKSSFLPVLWISELLRSVRKKTTCLHQWMNHRFMSASPLIGHFFGWMASVCRHVQFNCSWFTFYLSATGRPAAPSPIGCRLYHRDSVCFLSYCFYKPLTSTCKVAAAKITCKHVHTHILKQRVCVSHMGRWTIAEQNVSAFFG